MPITLELTAEQQRRLEEGTERHDADLVRKVILQAVEPAVEELMFSCPQPTPDERRAILREVQNLLADSPSLSDEAVSRAGLYESLQPVRSP